LIALLDDKNGLVSSTAARCILAGSFGSEEFQRNPALQDKLLLKLTAIDGDMALPGLTIDIQQLEVLARSKSAMDVELAIKCVPLAKENSTVVYEFLIRHLRNAATARIKASCLTSLAESSKVLELVTLADTDMVCSCTQERSRDVRVAALKVLGEMPDDEQVINRLLAHVDAAESSERDEFEVALAGQSLAKHARRNSKLRANVLQLLAERLPGWVSHGFGNPRAQRNVVTLLAVCEEIGTPGQSVAGALLRIAEDFRTPTHIRIQSLRTFGRLCSHTVDSVNSLIRLLGRSDPRLNEAVYATTLLFVEQLRRKVSSVRNVYAKLPTLVSILLTAWSREVNSTRESIDLLGASSIREAIIAIEEVMNQYDEFSERAPISTLADEGVSE
jgi:hypothetical protein